MDEQLIASILEKSLIGGAFIYMLHYFLGRFDKTLNELGNTLKDVSEILVTMNVRLDLIEKRIDLLEGDKEDDR